MIDVYVPSPTAVVSSSLDFWARSQYGEDISGVSELFNQDGVLIHFLVDPIDLSAVKADVAAFLDTHDPVFIEAERGGDTITVTVTKPRNLDGATALTLTVDDTPLPEVTALTDNAATVLIESADEITIGIVEDYPHTEVTI